MNLDDLNIELDENMQIKQLKRPSSGQSQTLATEAQSLSAEMDTSVLETMSIDTSSIDTSDLDMGEYSSDTTSYDTAPEIDPAPVASEPVASEAHAEEQRVAAEVVTHEVDDEATTEPEITEQAVTEQAVTEQAVTEQAVTEQAVTEQAVTEQTQVAITESEVVATAEPEAIVVEAQDEKADDAPAAKDQSAQAVSGEMKASEITAAETEVAASAPAPQATEEVAAVETPKVDPDKILFKDLPLSHSVQLSVQQAGYIEPTDIQARIIPEMLAGRDLVAQSQTGTGKTAAFALPILSKLDLSGKQERVLPTVLVLAPTRELAQQVATSFERYGDCIPRLRITAVYGGADYEPQLRSLRRGVHVVVGTPGRIIDHIKRGSLKLDAIQCLVLDEADEMLNMGFLEDVQFVLSNTPDTRQIALFSATMPGPIREIADKHLNDPVRVTVRKQTLTADSIKQKCVFVNERNKLDLLARIMEIETTDGVIVFTKTKDSTVSVAERLSKLGLSAAALNGDLPQNRRQRTVDQLKAGQLDIVVATDVAARGLDVQRISHVFNYDLPHDSESYVHRIGRTGRAGREGAAYIFLTPAQRGKLRYIENATRKPIEVVTAPTARQVNEKRLSDFKEQVIETAQRKKLRKPFQRVVAECIEESGLTAEEIAAAIAAVAQSEKPFVVGDIPEPDLRRGRQDSRAPRGERRGFSNARPPRRGMKRYRIEVGSSDGVKPGNIVGAIANEAGIAGCDIGAISIQDSYSTVDLPEEVTANIANQLSKTWVAGKQLRLRPVGDFEGSRGDRRGGGGGQSRWQSGGKKGSKAFGKRKGPGKPFKSGGKKSGGKKSFRPSK